MIDVKWLAFTKQLFLYLLVVISTISIMRLFLFEYRLLHYPYQWEIREGLQFNHGILLSEGKSIYSISQDPPVVLEPYGPVNPFISSVLMRVFGKELFAPRILSFLFFIVLQILIAYSVYRLTHSWKFAIIAMGVNTFLLSWIQWLLLCRPDSLGNLLMFVTLFVHWIYPHKKSVIFASLLLIILCFFTKVYFALGLLVVPLSYWFFYRDRRSAFFYIISGTFLLSLSVAIAHFVTDGFYTLFTFKLMSQWVTYSLVHLFVTMKALIAYFFPLFVLILYSIIKKDFRYDALNVFWIQIIIGIPVFMFFLLNTGGETFYWYCIIPALTLAGMDVLHRECLDKKSPIAVVILILLFFVMANKIVYRDISNGMIFPSATLAMQWKPVDDWVSRTEGQIINDDATTTIALKAGKKLHMEGIGYLNIKNGLARELDYKFRDIDAEIANRNYALIINPENEPYVRQYYRLAEVYNVPIQFGKSQHLKIYVPGESGRKN